MSTGRNRSEGWTYAKRSGHLNEQKVCTLFDDTNFCDLFSKRLGVSKIVSATVGGIHEKSVPGVLGRKTKSKTDLKLLLENGKTVNISIKKSWGGQAAFQTVECFIKGFELQFSTLIPDDIQYMLKLYFYGNPDTEKYLTDDAIIGGQPARLIKYQKDHGRLVWESIKKWDNKKADKLLDWFKGNIGKLAEYCFSRGLATNKDEWAEYVWFINLLGEDDLDSIYSVADIINGVEANKDLVTPGGVNGGSTIQFPFGFAQWHQAKIQVHDNLENLINLNIKSI